MRVAIDARYLDEKDSGIGEYTRRLIPALLEEDPALSLLLVRRRRTPPLLASTRLDQVVFPFPAISPLTQLGLGPFLRGAPIDLFHSPFDLTPRWIGVPLLVTIHDINWLVNPRYNSESPLVRLPLALFYGAALEASMAAAARILTVSEATRHAIVEHAGWLAPRVRVAPNGIDAASFQRLPTSRADLILERWIRPGTPFVLSVGSASPYKNHLNAVRGFLRAFAGRPEYRMVLVRRFLRRDRSLRQLLEQPSARQRVVVLPYVSREQLLALYSAARIFLHPSYYEGFGMPLLEAMAMGVPVVTSNLSSMPEVAGPAALLVEPGDPDSIAAALLILDGDEGQRRRLIEAGQQRMREFTWRRCARLTLQAYREALAQPAR